MDDLSQTTLLNCIQVWQSLLFFPRMFCRAPPYIITTLPHLFGQADLLSQVSFPKRAQWGHWRPSKLEVCNKTHLKIRRSAFYASRCFASMSLSNWIFFLLVAGMRLAFPKPSCSWNCQLSTGSVRHMRCVRMWLVYYILVILVSMRLEYFLWDALPKAFWQKLSIVWEYG